MWFRGALAACGLALLGGCGDTLDGRFIREGIGTTLYTPEVVDAARLQELYVGFICQQAGLSFVPDGDLLSCTVPAVSPAWAVFVQAGLNDIDRRCDAYLTWLDNRRRWIGPIHQQILDSQGATIAILTATMADPTKALGIVAAAFGFASHSFTNFNNRFLFEVEKSTVQSVVLTRQQKYREGLPLVIDNRPAAIYALRQYLRLCMPMTIETQINTTVKLFERGGLPALAEASDKPMINAGTVRTAVIRGATSQFTAPQKNPVIVSDTRLNRFEQQLTARDIERFQRAVCVRVTGDLGPLGSETRIKIKTAVGASDELLTDRKGILLRRILRDGVTCPGTT
jgi:hypothetical protein